MEILKTLEEKLKEAMKSRDKILVDCLRMIKASVKNKEIELIHPLSDAEFCAVLSTLLKQRRESIEQFNKGGRMDLVAKEEREVEILSSFLPKPLSDSELKGLIKEASLMCVAKGPRDMGNVMKALKEKTAGRVDGKVLADLVKEFLNSLS